MTQGLQSNASAMIATTCRYGALAIGGAVMVFPFFDMFLGALRTPAERLAEPMVYWPHDPQWHNFVRVFAELPMLAWLVNSIVVTVSITVLQMVTSALAGYALAKYRFFGSGILLRAVLGAQMFPFFLLIIPIFFLLRFVPLAGGNDLFGESGFGLLNSYAAMILPFAVSWYGIFLMRQSFMSVPDEIIDAARMDGAGEFRDARYFRVHLSLERSDLDHDRDAQRARSADHSGRHLSTARRVHRPVDAFVATGRGVRVDRAGHARFPAAAALLYPRADCRQREGLTRSPWPDRANVQNRART